MNKRVVPLFIAFLVGPIAWGHLYAAVTHTPSSNAHPICSLNAALAERLKARVFPKKATCEELTQEDLDTVDRLDLASFADTAASLLTFFTLIPLAPPSSAYLESVQGLAYLPNLKYLDLSGNRITSTEGLENLSALETLDLSKNKIATLDALMPLHNLHLLKQMNLVGNPILKKIAPEAIKEALPGVHNLVLNRQ